MRGGGDGDLTVFLRPQFFLLHRLGPSIHCSYHPPPPIKIRHHPKNHCRLATPKNIPILYLDLKKALEYLEITPQSSPVL